MGGVIPLGVAAVMNWLVAPFVMGHSPGGGSTEWMEVMVWYPLVAGLLAGTVGTRRTSVVTGLAATATVAIMGWDVAGILPVAVFAGVLTGIWALLVPALKRALLPGRSSERSD